MTFELCTTDDLGALLHRTIAGNDASALAAIAEATRLVQSYCRQRFEQVLNDVVILDGSGGEYLVLPQCPVSAVASVVEGGTARVLGVDYLWPVGDQSEHWRGGRLRRIWQPAGGTWASPLTWSCWPGAVVVTYSHGYADGDLPADLVGIATRIAGRRYSAGGLVVSATGVSGMASEQLGVYSTTYAPPVGEPAGFAGATSAWTLLPSEERALAPYRQPGIG